MLSIWLILIGFPFALVAEESRSLLTDYGVALLRQKRGDLPAAHSLLLAVVKRHPEAIEPKRTLMAVQESLTRLPAAIRTGHEILKRDPNDVRTALTVGRFLLEGRRASEAKAVLMPFAKKPLSPAWSWEWQQLLADVNDQLGDRPAAEASLLGQLEIVSNQGDVLRRARGWTADELAISQGEVLERLGRLRVAMNRPEQAADAFFAAARTFQPVDRAAARRLSLNLARAFRQLDDSRQATTHYVNYLKTKPDDLPALIELVELRLANGQVDDAVRDLETRLVASPKRTDLAWLLTVARLRQQRIDANAAILQFEQLARTATEPSLVAFAVRELPESAVYDWFEALAKQVDPEAGSGVKKNIRLGPLARAVADAIRADSARAKGFVDRSLVAIRNGGTPHHRTAEFAGWLAERARRIDDAEQAYRAIRNGTWEQTRPLIQLLERQFKWDEAAQLCLRFTRARTSNINALYILAYCRAELGQINDALVIVNQLSENESLFAEGKFTVRLQRCRILAAAGHTESAISLANQLFDMATGAGELARLRLVLGDALFTAKRYDDGDAQMRAILEDDPDDALALNNLAYNLAQANLKLADAEAFARHAVEQDRADRLRSGDPVPQSGTYLDTLAWVLFKRGQRKEARKVMAEAVALPDATFNPVVRDHFGDILMSLGERDAAIAEWQKAVERFPETTAGKRSGQRETVRKKIEKAR